MRMDDQTREQLLEYAQRTELSPSKLVNRYVKEGLRMDKHPAIAFRATPQGRRIVLAAHPRLQVIDVIGTWRGERQDVAATAKYLSLTEDEVRAVLQYYAEYKAEVDADLEDHLKAQQNYENVLAHRETRARRRAQKV